MILRVYDYALRVSYTRRRLRTMRKPTYDVVLVISNSPRADIYIPWLTEAKTVPERS